MEIEKEVVSLELAKKLKKLGYPQNDSQWYWCLLCNELHSIYSDDLYNHMHHHIMKRHISAKGVAPNWMPWFLENCCVVVPTVAELGRKGFYTWLGLKGWYVSPSPDGLIWDYKKDAQGIIDFMDKICPIDTEAEARALMVCYLLENKLIKEVINES